MTRNGVARSKPTFQRSGCVSQPNVEGPLCTNAWLKLGLFPEGHCDTIAITESQGSLPVVGKSVSSGGVMTTRAFLYGCA